MNLKSILCSALLGASLTATSLFANSVYIANTHNDGVIPDNTTGGSGEFLAITSHNGTFLTFCLERFVNITPEQSYTYTIAPRAYAGGADAHDPVGAGPAGDPISQGTAWLYEQFIKGTLVAPSGSYFDAATRDFNAGQLQKAFWMLEDEMGGTNYYVDLVKGIFGNTGAYLSVAGYSKVQAMNLWRKNTDGSIRDFQSMLIYVPDSGMTAALLGLGLLSLAAFRRKL